MMPPDVQVHVLMYGDFPELHSRLINSLREGLPVDMPAYFWCNELSPRCNDIVQGNANRRPSTWRVFNSFQNVPKYKAMRTMFASFKKPDDKFKWSVWFDDDSYLTDPKNWWPRTKAFIETREKENICYVGQPWYVHYVPGQIDFVKASAWYSGKPLQEVKGKPAVHFAQGAYWWLRADVIRMLDWPDVRLNHNGGDTLLGEAIYQKGLPFHKCDLCVGINKSARRGFHESPAGAQDKDFRR